MVSKHIKDSRLETDDDDVSIFRLPTNGTSKLSELFMELEKIKIDLRISNFGLDLTTMDDVFLKIGELQDIEEEEEHELPIEVNKFSYFNVLNVH